MRRTALLEALVDRITRIVRPHPIRVAIDGVDGVGKTTLADELVGPLGPAGSLRYRRVVFNYRRISRCARCGERLMCAAILTASPE